MNKAGIEQRISLLDNRILQLETDLAETGRQLSSAPAALVASASVGTPLGLNSGQITAIGIVSVVGAASVAFPIAVAMARRIWRGASRRDAAPVAPQSAERMERLEQAVDAIAIEIERVSEGQRFVTKIMAEKPASVAWNAGSPADQASSQSKQPLALGAGEAPAKPIVVPERERVRN